MRTEEKNLDKNLEYKIKLEGLLEVDQKIQLNLWLSAHTHKQNMLKLYNLETLHNLKLFNLHFLRKASFCLSLRPKQHWQRPFFFTSIILMKPPNQSSICISKCQRGNLIFSTLKCVAFLPPTFSSFLPS